MNLSIGIVGLPNVGKSTLFNALTKQQVLAANYPFATIDPNHGIVQVLDPRLTQIANIENPKKIVPATIEFVDIAGIVKGASEGAGLGNQFLSNIRECSAIAQVVRAFENDDITHVENSVDPIRDIKLIEMELILKDLESVEKREASVASKAKLDKKLQPTLQHLTELRLHLESQKLARNFAQSTDQLAIENRRELFLLTDKPMLYIVNVDEDGSIEMVKKITNSVNSNSKVLAIDFKTESELAGLTDEERVEFMAELGISESGLDLLSREAYSILGLISFFTSGPQESRAWTIQNGYSAPEAAGTIHGDIQKNFIAADVVNYADFVSEGGWNGAREKGKVRLEGKTYTMQDGDVVLFKHNG